MTEEMIEVEEARLILEGKTRYGSFAFFEKQNLGVSFYLIVWNATACIKILSIVGTAKIHTSYLSRKPREFSCKFFLACVNFYRFNAKNWQFTVYFAVITQKIGNFLCILS